jgi:SpoVK/Ycf46/Vps4 family AAA+-type ATPase
MDMGSTTRSGVGKAIQQAMQMIITRIDVLLVEHIQDIKWNSAVFDQYLVLEEGKKEFLRALITTHNEKSQEMKTDYMDGKGEGLIILLHGAPGTGKTLTAESVAEYMQRPLYRMTCGDLGTDADSVGQSLESAFRIGSTWDCVVLLDEADVFFEERRLMDLHHTALVSVFLRVMEYYDGILILTTNRVGTFDEAFRSRIQLALHYPPLDREGRWEVWRNFVQSLSEAGENINTEGIDKQLDMLARHKLNGRQIRNTINTARQLARYKKETLRFAHVHQAVAVVNEFDKYFRDVRTLDDEEYAREQGWRNDVNPHKVD